MNTPIPFANFVSTPAAAITQSSGTFTLVDPGTYLVTVLLNLPSQSNVNTTFHLRANGVIIPSTQTRVVAPSNTTSLALSAIVTSTGTTTVSLTSTRAFSLTGDATTDILSTITFLKLN